MIVLEAWGALSPDEAWGAVVVAFMQLSAVGLALAVCALGGAIIVAVAANEWRLWRRAREQAVGDLLRRAGPPPNASTTEAMTQMWTWTCATCGHRTPNPSVASPGFGPCTKCGSMVWRVGPARPLPVVFDWDWPAA